MLPWLRYTLIAGLLAVQALTLIGVLISSKANTENLLREHARVVMHHLVESAAENSLRFVQPAERSAQLTARLLGQGVFDSSDNTKLERYFLAQLLSQDQMNGMYLAKPNGEFLFVKRDKNGFLTKNIQITAGVRVVRLTSRDKALKQIVQKTDLTDTYDPRSRPWYKAALASDQQIWTGPYVFFTSKAPGVTSAVAIRRTNDSLVGVVGVDIEVTQLSEFIERIPVSQNGQAFIMDTAGSAISFPNLSQILLEQAKKTDKPVLPKISSIGNDAVRALLAHSSQVTNVNRDFFEFQVGQTREFGMLSPFSIGYGTKWLIGLHAPVNDFTGQINQQSGQYVWQVIGISAFTWLLAIPLAFGITRPLSVLMRQATIDSLTGLLNRAEFYKRADAQMRLSRKLEQPVTVALLDLDGFKGVNDFWGHKAGDEVLLVTAERIRHALRASDLIGRLGGDEFVMLLPGISPKEAEPLLERVRAAIYETPILSSLGEHQLGATIGVAFVEHETSIQAVIAKADSMLLSGKSAGKNQTRLTNV